MSTGNLEIQSFVLLVGGAGFIVFLEGIILGKILKISQKIHERGLDIPLGPLSVPESFHIFLSNPDISIPVMMAFFGGILVIFSVIIFIISIIFNIK
jgi:hypothetical protein